MAHQRRPYLSEDLSDSDYYLPQCIICGRLYRTGYCFHDIIYRTRRIVIQRPASSAGDPAPPGSEGGGDQQQSGDELAHGNQSSPEGQTSNDIPGLNSTTAPLTQDAKAANFQSANDTQIIDHERGSISQPHSGSLVVLSQEDVKILLQRVKSFAKSKTYKKLKSCLKLPTGTIVEIQHYAYEKVQQVLQGLDQGTEDLENALEPAMTYLEKRFESQSKKSRGNQTSKNTTTRSRKR